MSSSDSKHEKAKKVGNYILTKKLGKGAFSVVKFSTDIRDNSTWAVKVIEVAKVHAEQMEDQLKREIAITKKLKHPHIVQMREVLKTRNHIHIVLELVPNGELFDKIVNAKRFTEPVARRYFQQLILGVEYCHKQGVAHRDLKPENLLLDADDNLKINDFGLSALQEDKLLRTTCGTPNYVAPEVLKDRGYDGFAADIWSCGVILFVMLAGFLPFEDANLRTLFEKIQRGRFNMPAFFSEGARNLISKILVVDPKQRITIDEIMRDPWFSVDFHHVTGADVEPVSADEIENAFDESEAFVESVERAGPIATMNAFDLASRLMAGKMTPLMGNAAPAVKNSARFIAAASIAETMEALQSFLSAHRIEYTVKQDLNVLKCVRPGYRLMTFAIHIMPTVSDTLVMVDVRRGKGDRLEFNEFFRELLAAMRHIVHGDGGVSAL